MTATTEAEPKAGSEIQTQSNKQHRVRWLALLVLGLSLFVGVVDSSVVNVVTPAMKEEFQATDAQMALVVMVYSLVFAAFLLLFGKVGHRVDLRRLMAVGASLFGLSSLLVALVPSIGIVNGMRAVTGLAAAMGGSIGLALLHGIFKGRDRALAFGINVPICPFIVLGSYLWITEVKHESRSSIDYAGAAIVGLGLSATIRPWSMCGPGDADVLDRPGRPVRHRLCSGTRRAGIIPISSPG